MMADRERDGRDGVAGRDGRDFDSGYMRSQFEQIQAALCELKPLPTIISGMKTTLESVASKVSDHDVTLHGEKSVTGLVGRVEALEQKFTDSLDKVNMRLNLIMGVGGVVGTAIILWLIRSWLALIH